MATRKRTTEPAENERTTDIGEALDRSALERVITDQPLQARDLRAAMRALDAGQRAVLAELDRRISALESTGGGDR